MGRGWQADDDCDGRVDEDCTGTPRTTTYGYNAFNQLLDATDPDGTTLFTWDDNGNQTERAAPEGTTGYTWDARDRLAEIALPNGTTAVYGYDTENLRVSMDDAGGARRVLLDGLEEHGEVDEATAELVARFDHDPTRIDALLAQDTVADGRAAMLTDALGSVYGLADDAATLRARYGYDVYGARSASLEEIGTRWGFTGRSHGELMYLRERYYASQSGHFLQDDPLWLVKPLSSASAYQYANAVPTMLVDPTGRRASPEAALTTSLVRLALYNLGRIGLTVSQARELFETVAALARIVGMIQSVSPPVPQVSSETGAASCSDPPPPRNICRNPTVKSQETAGLPESDPDLFDYNESRGGTERVPPSIWTTCEYDCVIEGVAEKKEFVFPAASCPDPFFPP